MGTALSLFVVMIVLLFAVRVASVALRLTGLAESVAKFQALSAISGAGFTTKESESIVNYPVQRQIMGILIIIGNLGLFPGTEEPIRVAQAKPVAYIR